ncbi:putative membrane protein YphA, DoxX/SURF4 family [Cyclonatronum proteinivorum]|uniref:Putative membrane protein YphA, DoxX/SURF4 family n=1 Tax=Cyclonatronum proteinivorum TaxID=1457365 RepID=A0A345UG78_9BACT|nr:DoxX family protein [Cyclonatronum proteinivorum]AXI99479.1 putative membrane protein YphA, DoxX/SURF4 family [Cyclonatronum proteinivorum]
MELLKTDTDKATILIRLVVGIVFVSEGLQKFIWAELRGAGRFERIGIPFPEFNGYFVGGMEVLCGLLILAGFMTRYAAVPLIIIMLTALFTTKLPILLGTGFWGFSLRELEHYGLLSALHESRNDLAMLAGSIFLFIKGGGYWSVDLRRFGTYQSG